MDIVDFLPVMAEGSLYLKNRPRAMINMPLRAGRIRVALLKDSKLGVRVGEARSTGRLNSRVAVAIEWSEAGQNLRAEGYTVDISPKGCLAVIPHSLAVGQKVKLINLSNQISCEAVLIWRGHDARAGWELGLALQLPPADFWGLDL